MEQPTVIFLGVVANNVATTQDEVLDESGRDLVAFGCRLAPRANVLWLRRNVGYGGKIFLDGSKECAHGIARPVRARVDQKEGQDGGRFRVVGKMVIEAGFFVVVPERKPGVAVALHFLGESSIRNAGVLVVADGVVFPRDVGPADELVAARVPVVPFAAHAVGDGICPLHGVILVDLGIDADVDTELELVPRFVLLVGKVRFSVQVVRWFEK